MYTLDIKRDIALLGTVWLKGQNGQNHRAISVSHIPLLWKKNEKPPAPFQGVDFQASLYHGKQRGFMEERVSAIDLTEEIFLALKDFFAGTIECGVTEIDLTLYNGQKFKIAIQEN